MGFDNENASIWFSTMSFLSNPMSGDFAFFSFLTKF